MSRPLRGIRIIEVGHMLAGPYCGTLLADLGAAVIKVEPPEDDIGRRISPHAIGPHNAYFAGLNRNEKSVVLELASAEDRTEFNELVRSSHAVLTNLRPTAIRKPAPTYDALCAINPRIVCAALTGYRLEGRFADHAAYAYVIQALTDVMSLTGEPDGPPPLLNEHGPQRCADELP